MTMCRLRHGRPVGSVLGRQVSSGKGLVGQVLAKNRGWPTYLLPLTIIPVYEHFLISYRDGSKKYALLHHFMSMVSYYISNQHSERQKRSKRSGRCRQVGSDKERSKGRVGSGSGNARGCLGPNILSLALYFFPYSTHKLPSFKTKLHCMQHKAKLCLTKHITVFYVPINI